MKEDLTIKQIAELKTEAENEINRVLEDFQSKTGVWFESVEIVSIDSSFNEHKSVIQHAQGKINVPWQLPNKARRKFINDLL